MTVTEKTIRAQLVDGKIPAGETCAASPYCRFKTQASNGQGCPVADGRVSHKPFSCGAARLYAIATQPVIHNET